MLKILTMLYLWLTMFVIIRYWYLSSQRLM